MRKLDLAARTTNVGYIIIINLLTRKKNERGREKLKGKSDTVQLGVDELATTRNA
jgi:hypothetical protein